jgi:hypothetical protein
MFNNRAYACCEKLTFSNYSVSRLDSHQRRGLQIAFASAAADAMPSAAAEAKPAFHALSRSSGGNALITALSACQTVNLYGAGLLRLSTSSSGQRSNGDRTSEGSQLVYAHYYDPRVGHCTSDAEALRMLQRDCAERMDRHSKRNRRGGRADERCETRAHEWRRDRIETELGLHILHLLGIVQWVL